MSSPGQTRASQGCACRHQEWTSAGLSQRRADESYAARCYQWEAPGMVAGVANAVGAGEEAVQRKLCRQLLVEIGCPRCRGLVDCCGSGRAGAKGDAPGWGWQLHDEWDQVGADRGRWPPAAAILQACG